MSFSLPILVKLGSISAILIEANLNSNDQNLESQQAIQADLLLVAMNVAENGFNNCSFWHIYGLIRASSFVRYIPASEDGDVPMGQLDKG